MSQLSEAWNPPQQGAWHDCPRYGIKITGCSRYFVCQSFGIEDCIKLFPKVTGMNIASTPNRLKQIAFSIKQGVRSVKKAGV